MQTLKAMQSSTEVAIERNQESAAMCVDVVDDPEPMTALRIVEHDMTAIISVDARRDRQEPVEIDGPTCGKLLRRGSNDDGGGRLFRPPQGRRIPGRIVGLMRESSTPIGVRVESFRPRATMSRTQYLPAYCGSPRDRRDCVGETRRQIDLGPVA